MRLGSFSDHQSDRSSTAVTPLGILPILTGPSTCPAGLEWGGGLSQKVSWPWEAEHRRASPLDRTNDTCQDVGGFNCARRCFLSGGERVRAWQRGNTITFYRRGSRDQARSRAGAPPIVSWRFLTGAGCQDSTLSFPDHPCASGGWVDAIAETSELLVPRERRACIEFQHSLRYSASSFSPSFHQHFRYSFPTINYPKFRYFASMPRRYIMPSRVAHHPCFPSPPSSND